MKFIKQFFGLKLRAYTVLCDLIVTAWEEKVYAASILILLWTIFCTIFGLLLLPLDFICDLIAYLVWPDEHQKITQDLHDEFLG